MYRFIIFLCLTGVAFSQLELEGLCDFTDKSQNILDVTGILGTWLQYKRINNSLEIGQCSNLTLALRQNSSSVVADVVYMAVEQKEAVQKNGTITLGKGGVIKFWFDNLSYDYVIQKTDYKNYAILYGCNDNNETKSVYSQLLTRGPLTNEIEAQFKSVVQGNVDLQNATFIEVSHSKKACNRGTLTHLTNYFTLFIGVVLMKNL